MSQHEEHKILSGKISDAKVTDDSENEMRPPFRTRSICDLVEYAESHSKYESNNKCDPIKEKETNPNIVDGICKKESNLQQFEAKIFSFHKRETIASQIDFTGHDAFYDYERPVKSHSSSEIDNYEKSNIRDLLAFGQKTPSDSSIRRYYFKNRSQMNQQTKDLGRNKEETTQYQNIFSLMYPDFWGSRYTNEQKSEEKFFIIKPDVGKQTGKMQKRQKRKITRKLSTPSVTSSNKEERRVYVRVVPESDVDTVPYRLARLEALSAQLYMPKDSIRASSAKSVTFDNRPEKIVYDPILVVEETPSRTSNFSTIRELCVYRVRRIRRLLSEWFSCRRKRTIVVDTECKLTGSIFKPHLSSVVFSDNKYY